MIALVLTALLGAEPVKLAAPQFQCAAVDLAKAQFFSDYFAQELAATGIRVTTRAEIQAIIGVERQKQLMGCADESASCLTELAGALGVEGVITGSVAKTEGGSFALTLKIVSARDATPLSLARGRFKNEEALLDFFTDQAPRMAAEVRKALHPNEPAPPPAAVAAQPTGVEESKPSGPISKGWIVVGAGAAALIAGGTLYGLARADAGALMGGTASVSSSTELSAAVASGQAKESAGVFLLGLGGGAAVAGLLWAVGPASSKTPWVSIGAGAAALIAGAVLYGLARGDQSAIQSGSLMLKSASELSAAVTAGRGKEVVGETLLGAGAGAAVGGLLAFLLGNDTGAHVSLAPTAHGMGLTFSKELW